MNFQQIKNKYSLDTKYKVLKKQQKHNDVKEVWIVRVVMEVRVIDKQYHQLPPRGTAYLAIAVSMTSQFWGGL